MEEPRHRAGLKKAVASLLVGLFVLAASASGLDRLSARIPGLERVVPKQFRADAARSAASLELLKGDPDGAVTHAVQAVRHDPVNPHSVALLATVRLGQEDLDAAYSAYRIAALFGWRDQFTQLYWYSQALAVGDLPAAMDRADAILRAFPAFPQAGELLLPFEESAAGRAELVDHLQDTPPWFDDYVRIDQAASPERADKRAAVLAATAEAGHVLGCVKISPFVKGLLERGRRKAAEAVWNGHCADNPVGGLLADSSLGLIDKAVAFPFGWIVERTGDVSLARDGTDPKVVVLSNSGSATKRVMYQPLALSPGTYRIGVTLDEPVAPGSLLYSFACDGPLSFPDRRTADLSEGPRSFEVGSCGQVTLAIWAAAGAKDIRLRGIELAKEG